jgi:hypothetical protein
MPPLPPGLQINGQYSNYTPSDSGGLLGLDDVSPDGANGPVFIPAPETGFYQVAKLGGNLFGITNGQTISGVITLPVEVASTDISLQSVAISANGVTIPGTYSLEPPFPTPFLNFTIDSSRLANGTYYIQARASWLSGTTDENADPFESFSSTPISIDVSNEISFPDWEENFGGNACWFTFSSATPDVDWQLDVYDSQLNYIGSFADHSVDGLVDVQWNLVGPDGVTHNDPYYYSVVTTFDALGNAQARPKGSTVAPMKVKRPDNFPTQAIWTVARQDLFSNVSNNPNFFSAIDSMTAVGEESGGVIPNPPDRYIGNAYILRYGSNVPVNLKKQDWDLLKLCVSNAPTRNFYYFGHGGGRSIGGEPGRNTIEGDEMSSTDIAAFLHIFDPTHPQFHPYRFVWLDGCDTATGDWARRFGMIEKIDVPIGYYQKHKIRPSTFCGWGETLYAMHGGRMDMDFAYYRSDFAFDWLYLGMTVKDAHADAYNSNPSRNRLSRSLRIYGYGGLRMNDYNAAADWP